MKIFASLRSSRLAVACAVAVAVPPGVPAQTTTPAAKPTAKPAATQTAVTAVPEDPGWPRTYTTSGGSAVLYQPQIASWEGQKHMVAWSAVAYQANGATKTEPRDGQDRSRHARGGRRPAGQLHRLQDHRVQLLHAVPRPDARGRGRLQQAMPGERSRSSRSIACSPPSTRARSGRRTSPGVKADPPKIFTSTTPAILVEPRRRRDLESDQGRRSLQFAVNTNWDLFQAHADEDALPAATSRPGTRRRRSNGPWTPAGTLPASFKKLPADDNFKEVTTSLPGKTVAASSDADGVRQHGAGRAAAAPRRARRTRR